MTIDTRALRDAHAKTDEGDVRCIVLTQGYTAIVDAEIYEWVSAVKWFADVKPRSVYAKTSFKIDGKQHSMRMHRLVLGILDSSIDIDHINHNGLDNRRSNLRSFTRLASVANQANRRPLEGCTSIYKGVGWNKEEGRWRARIALGPVRTTLGFFDEEADAAKAYDEAACDIFGSAAYLNFGVYI